MLRKVKHPNLDEIYCINSTIKALKLAKKMHINGYRKTGQRGKVVNAENWSTERWSTGKTGQCGKVVNAERWSTENWSTGEKRINFKFCY
jgi:hypothetical protein